MRRLLPRRLRERMLLLALVVLGGAMAAFGVAFVTQEPADISNPDVAFEETAPPTVSTPEPTTPKRKGLAAFAWPTYGYTKARTRYMPLATPLRPPFKTQWKLPGSVLLEFGPALGGRSLFLLKNNGALYGLSRRTGEVRWKRKLGYLAASGPAYKSGTVYVTLLERSKGAGAGRIVAVNAANGRTKWSRPLPSRSESSPVVDRGMVFFGTEDGTVFALRAKDGSVKWTYKAPGAVKGGVALADKKVYVGAYGGEFFALRESNGNLAWRASSSEGVFGIGGGNFYATPSVAYGRVYVGNTDGFVYSFSTADGRLAWRKQTGGFVYSSAAVAHVPGGKPTVYVGSYDGQFYALDARTGSVRWQRRAEGRISGGAIVLGDLVFYSTLAKTTTALGARTGNKVWTTRRGGYNPIVSDGRRIYLTGYTSLFGLSARLAG